MGPSTLLAPELVFSKRLPTSRGTAFCATSSVLASPFPGLFCIELNLHPAQVSAHTDLSSLPQSIR